MINIVTGGRGFIGSHLIAALKKRGKEVFNIDMPNDIRLHVGLGNEPIDTLYHLADCSAPLSSPRICYETNVTGTFNVLEAARLAGVKKFVYAASASCYGNGTNAEQAGERLPCDPQYPYALTKYLGEQLVMHYGKVYGMDIVSLRIFNCYGRCSLTKSAYGSIFNTFLAQKANGKPMTIIGDGTQSRDFVYVNDVVEALILAAEKGKGVFNCGTGIATSINRVAEIIQGETINIPERAGEPHCIYADNTRLRSIGWQPKINIERGIGKMLENLDYWKNAKVWELEAIKKETREWQRCLK